VAGGEEVPLKPGMRLYATQLWAQRRGFTLAADPAAAAAAQQRLFNCDREGCAPLGPVRPAIAAWWYKRAPNEERSEALCATADILIFRAEAPVPAACRSAVVLTRADFAAGGAAEVFAAPGGWRIAWSQPLPGDRPWSETAGG
jgi:competence protein ComEC